MMLININNNKKSKMNLDESMVPAINIVFLLLIFFMIAGKIEKSSSDLLVPKSQNQTKYEKQKISININSSKEFFVNDEKLNTTLLEKLKSLKISNDSIITCLIHKDLPASTLDEILEVAQILGIKQLNIATKSI